MFEALREKLESAFSKLRSRGKISEADVDGALREIRRSLLEADVDLGVVRGLIEKIRARAVTLDVLESITAAQHISTVVYEELIALMGTDVAPVSIASKPPTVILMAGLQGSGKTTTTVKLARRLQSGHNPLVVACDLRRPAAVEQLRVLAEASKVAFFGPEPGETDVLKVVRGASAWAESHLNDVILLDTAGRLHVDQELMDELSSVAKLLPPHEILLVVDAMTGQEAVNVAKSFHKLLNVTGLVLTKLDGDARGGSALAIRAATGIPVKFAGMGEAVDALEVFDARRMAGRIMGMGDIEGLLEKVRAVGAEDVEKMAESLQSREFTLETLLLQFQQIEKMGPLGKVMEMIPGFSRIKGMNEAEIDNSIIVKNRAIIQSMTLQERRNPKIIKGSRRRRIALGSGTSVQMVNQLLAQYEQMKKLFKTFSGGSGKGFNLKSLFGGNRRFNFKQGKN
ncbi:MAG: signal recognition particle protein [Synergistaceae bacterium]|jgi:signal recognition particle subunit SRP54|nr:signal recognition particle protein [Synergistaceae bacterium]